MPYKMRIPRSLQVRGGASRFRPQAARRSDGESAGVLPHPHSRGRTIVCPVEESTAGSRVAGHAEWFARSLHARLLLLRIGAGPRSGIARFADQVARSALSESADFIVIGSRGRGVVRASLFGSVWLEVLRRTNRPVLVVPPLAVRAGAPDPPRSTIVCGLGESGTANQAARLAAGLAHELGVELVYAHAYAPFSISGSSVPAGVDRFGAANGVEQHTGIPLPQCLVPGPATRVITGHGPAAQIINQVAAEQHAGLIVVGAGRHGRARRVLFGSVPMELAASAARPVLVVPQDVRAAWRGDPDEAFLHARRGSRQQRRT